MKLADKSVSPTSRRVKENYMDEGGYGRTRTVTVDDGGMTLRQYYAGLAMQGILAHPEGFTTPEGYAKDAVAQADALIAELDKSA